MQLIGIVDSLINRRNRKIELEAPIGDHAFENVIFSVLVFIMEKTLTEEEECTIRTISNFVGTILEENFQYPDAKNQALPITEYIIKTILQFDGRYTYYPVMDYEKGEWKKIRIKLLSEKVEDRHQGYVSIYSLTDQGYDLLFRTKEVDSELSFSVEEFKLRELIRRKNYKKALTQSASLVQMVRQKKHDLDQFIQSARGNIQNIDLTKFDELISSIYALLLEEYQALSEIDELVRKSEVRIREDYSIHGELTPELKKAQMELTRIRRNLSMARKEQMNLINEREGSYNILKTNLAESFHFTTRKRFDLEKVILKPMEKMSEENNPELWKLFTPLFRVNPTKQLPVSLIYRAQGKLSEEEPAGDAGILIDEIEEDLEKERAERINRIYLEILRSVLEEATKKEGSIDFKSYLNALKKDPEKFQALTQENLLFLTILKLYEMETLDIRAWKESEKLFLGNLTEEFNVDNLLYQLLSSGTAFDEVDRIEFQKIENDSFEVVIDDSRKEILYKTKIELDNISIRVVKHSG